MAHESQVRRASLAAVAMLIYPRPCTDFWRLPTRMLAKEELAGDSSRRNQFVTDNLMLS